MSIRACADQWMWKVSGGLTKVSAGIYPFSYQGTSLNLIKSRWLECGCRLETCIHNSQNRGCKARIYCHPLNVGLNTSPLWGVLSEGWVWFKCSFLDRLHPISSVCIALLLYHSQEHDWNEGTEIEVWIFYVLLALVFEYLVCRKCETEQWSLSDEIWNIHYLSITQLRRICCFT